jgi:hypothetical protein
MTIKDFIEQFELHNNFDGDTISLGYGNDWSGQKWVLLNNILNEYRVPDTTKSRTLGNCNTEYSFVVEMANERFNIVYRVDSGD